MSGPRVFGVDYQFLSCGSVFTDGLAHAAAALGIEYQHAEWKAANLMDRIRAFNPDLLFVTHGRRFSRQYRGQFSQYRSAIWLLDEPYEVDDTCQFSKDFGAVFVSDPSTLHRHRNAHYLPVCADPVVQFPTDAPKTAMVGFIGGGNPTRNTYLSALASAGLLTYVIGGPFVDSVQRLSRGHNIPPSQTADWYRKTRIILNVFRWEHHYNSQKLPATSLNPRVYEAIACGALVVSEWRPEVPRLVPDLPTFRSPEECVNQVVSLLADPERADRIRQRCAAQLHGETYAARLQTVLQTCGLAVAA